MQQLSLIPPTPRFHGGELALGKRKNRRPLSRKDPIHFTLKAKVNLYQSRFPMLEELTRLARRFGIELFDLAVSFDHVHFVAKIRSRRDYAAFIRSFTGLMARKLGKGMWKLLPFSRVGLWGKDFREMRAYCEKNREETLGHQPYEPRVDWYKKWRKNELSRQAPNPRSQRD